MTEIASVLENTNKPATQAAGTQRLRGLNFHETLARAGGQADVEAARQAATDLVATTFIKPMLETMRNDPMRSDLFKGGSGEEMFAEHLDSELAQRISASLSLSLTDAITRDMTRQAPRVTAQSPVAASERMDLRG